MTRLVMLASILFVSAVFAQVEIPHVHENGDVIDADEINKNLDVVAKAVPPRDCSTDQIIKWDGSAWVCASKSIVENDCGSDGDKPACVALCEVGTTVVSGGCYTSGIPTTDLGALGYLVKHESRPLPDLSGWHCFSFVSGSSDGPGIVMNYWKAYAICQ